MTVFTIITSILGILGIGAIANTIISTFLQSNLDRRKILYDKKFEYYSELCEFVISLNAGKNRKEHLLESLAASTRVRMLLENKSLEEKIERFIYDLETLEQLRAEKYAEEDPKKKEELHIKQREEFIKLDKIGEIIIKGLKNDLNDTLFSKSKINVFFRKM